MSYMPPILLLPSSVWISYIYFWNPGMTIVSVLISEDTQESQRSQLVPGLEIRLRPISRSGPRLKRSKRLHHQRCQHRWAGRFEKLL